MKKLFIFTVFVSLFNASLSSAQTTAEQKYELILSTNNDFYYGEEFIKNTKNLCFESICYITNKVTDIIGQNRINSIANSVSNSGIKWASSKVVSFVLFGIASYLFGYSDYPSLNYAVSMIVNDAIDKYTQGNTNAAEIASLKEKLEREIKG